MQTALTQRYLGEGLQYRVYEIDEYRVSKVPKTCLEKWITLVQWGYKNPITIFRDALIAARMNERSIKTLKSLMTKLDASLFGNPYFLNDLSYEQDKAVTLETYFKEHSLSENKRVIDRYVDSILLMWRYGISDSVFNFSMNNAINSQGSVITIDLGELVFSKKCVAELVRAKKWLHQHSFTHLTDTKLKDYFSEQTSQLLTIENLNTYWRSEATRPASHRMPEVFYPIP
jgi:hypothetical protein